MRTSIFRIELAMDAWLKRKMAEAGVKPEEEWQKPDRQTVAEKLKRFMRGKRGGKSG